MAVRPWLLVAVLLIGRPARLGGALPPAASSTATTSGQEVPEEVRALAGSYTGEWILYGVDAAGNLVERMTWTDEITASEPRREGDRAFVQTVDTMQFGGGAGTHEVTGREGYFLGEKGALGDYFIEANGQVIRLQHLAADVWSYCIPAPTQELQALGFPAGSTGTHVMVKVVTQESGATTHRVTRVTTVQWKEKSGLERCTQFTSLKGFHRRH